MGTFGLIIVLVISIIFNIYFYINLKNIKKEEQIEKKEEVEKELYEYVSSFFDWNYRKAKRKVNPS